MALSASHQSLRTCAYQPMVSNLHRKINGYQLIEVTRFQVWFQRTIIFSTIFSDICPFLVLESLALPGPQAFL